MPVSLITPASLGGVPAFSATRTTTQSIGANAWTKAQFNSEDFDTNSNFDPATNYRFTPTVAGYYQINWILVFDGINSEGITAVYKTGSLWCWGTNLATTNTHWLASGGSALIYLNGTTDYVEIFAYQNSGISINIFTGVGTVPSRFSGCLVRAA